MNTQKPICRIGADPELFLTDRRSEFVPAFGLFGGTKNEAIPLPGWPAGFSYLEDGAALEFNIAPQETAESFATTISSVMTDLRRLVNSKGLNISRASTLVLTGKYIQDPRGKVIGCIPDFDAYADNPQRPPFSAESLGYARHAGGHIHVQYNVDMLPPNAAARFLDLYLGAPSLVYDKQHSRRPVYGRAGLYRPKAYGIEYRTMSNWWVHTSDFVQRSMMADNALRFARHTYEGDWLERYNTLWSSFPWTELKHAIDSGDSLTGRQLIEMANDHYYLDINRF